ncbi:DUF2147 domain-containing protein [uncultured Sphingomonas sp.]|uniref:DUF2147 domain-containing protein n=1 Tax=uncultured Sphingomonas sp. TaxID=158754 RepID=UPI0035CB6E61
MIHVILTLQAAAQAAAPVPALPTIEGQWHNLTSSVEVRIGPCAKALCGWATRASPGAGAAAKNGGTPELVGTELLRDVTPSGKGRWSGTLFVPDRDITVWASVALADAGTITMRGCLVPNFICKSQT